MEVLILYTFDSPSLYHAGSALLVFDAECTKEIFLWTYLCTFSL